MLDRLMKLRDLIEAKPRRFKPDARKMLVWKIARTLEGRGHDKLGVLCADAFKRGFITALEFACLTPDCDDYAVQVARKTISLEPNKATSTQASLYTQILLFEEAANDLPI